MSKLFDNSVLSNKLISLNFLKQTHFCTFKTCLFTFLYILFWAGTVPYQSLKKWIKQVLFMKLFYAADVVTKGLWKQSQNQENKFII